MSATNSTTPQELSERLQTDEPVDLIDVRTPIEYRELHIEFARNIPLDELDPKSVMQERNGTGDQPLYVICQSGARGEKARQQFEAAGYHNVINIEGGTQACIDTKLPLVRGKNVISLERQVRIAAGFLVVLGVVLGWQIHLGFLGISAFVGSGLMFAGITGTCGMGMMLAKMPWNR